MMKDVIILASASPTRLEILSAIHINPIVMPADVDESEFRGEKPEHVAERLSKAKAEKIALQLGSGLDLPNCEQSSLYYIIGADSVCAIGRRTLPKALNKEMVAECLSLLSGRRHNIYTGVYIIKKTLEKTEVRSRVVKTVVQFKRLSALEIEFYSNCGEGVNKAGGYGVQGYAESYVSFIRGGFSNIRGLPIHETRNMLTSLGYKAIVI